MVRKTLRNKSFRRKSLKRSKTLERNKSFRRKSLRNKSFRRKSLKKMRGGRPKTSQTCDMKIFGQRAVEYGSEYDLDKISEISNGNVTYVVTKGRTSYYKIVICLDERKKEDCEKITKSFSVSDFKRYVENFISNIKENPNAALNRHEKLSTLNRHLKNMTQFYLGTMGVENCSDRVIHISYVCQWLEYLCINHIKYLFKDGTKIDKTVLIDKLKSALSGVAATP